MESLHRSTADGLSLQTDSPHCHAEVIRVLVGVGTHHLIRVTVEAALGLSAQRGGGCNHKAVKLGARHAVLAPVLPDAISLINPVFPAESPPHALLGHHTRGAAPCRARRQKGEEASPGSSGRRSPLGVRKEAGARVHSFAAVLVSSVKVSFFFYPSSSISNYSSSSLVGYDNDRRLRQ